MPFENIPKISPKKNFYKRLFNILISFFFQKKIQKIFVYDIDPTIQYLNGGYNKGAYRGGCYGGIFAPSPLRSLIAISYIHLIIKVA